jgi:hypothetical protein
MIAGTVASKRNTISLGTEVKRAFFMDVEDSFVVIKS